jgi:hypothetical protein
MQALKDMTGTLNSLLRGELAATETYQQALNVLGHAPGALDLRRIHNEHRDAANTLRRQIRQAGGEPDRSSGAWGTWAALVEGTALALGPHTAAQTLKQGEEHGVGDYERALQNEHLPPECKTLIHDQLLPHTREHVATLERILEAL